MLYRWDLWALAGFSNFSLYWTVKQNDLGFIDIWYSFYDQQIMRSNGKKTGVLRQLVCFLIESDALVSSAVYGSVYGLVVITAERYFKIVHAVAHRNRYRRWMTYVGVATPWLIGLFTSVVPSLTTTRFVDGTCRTLVCSTTLLWFNYLVYPLPRQRFFGDVWCVPATVTGEEDKLPVYLNTHNL